MVGVFPIPRDALPEVIVSPEEHYGRKMQMNQMLESLVEEYERYVDAGREVDRRRWSSSASRDRLKLYKERRIPRVNSKPKSKPWAMTDEESESPSSPTGQSRQYRRDSSVLGSVLSFQSSSASSTLSEEAADTMQLSLMVGESTGRMENAMIAAHATTQKDLALVDVFLHEDVADCSVLHTMEGPSVEDPYHFLGYKWFVKKSPAPSQIVRHRDSVYLEGAGFTKTKSGEILGYHIMHSVDLMGFPELREHNCLRSSQSIRSLYRQRPGDIVEIFVLGNVHIAGFIVGPLASMFVTETLLSMPKMIECGEAKRLTKMAQDMEAQRLAKMPNGKHPNTAICGLCHQTKKRFGSSVSNCEVCGTTTCSRCRVPRRIFVSEGLLGRFVKVSCCKTCVLAAKSPNLIQSTVVEAKAKDGMDLKNRVSRTSSTSTASTARTSTGSVARMGSLPTAMAATAPNHSIMSGTIPEDDTLNGSFKSSQWTPVVSSSMPSSLPSTMPASVDSKAELFMRMLELQQRAEDTYNTLQQNEYLMPGAPQYR
ncbi:hypothetical protein Poli38472_008668 [Pythium oligandrum]|uniref:FYVE-type domain-containing protein n=1 Tax=Pythium oligandrum TaxID=41045 RepID=A0A8K1C400_PYTOL|nr:hypothetical protein Poli38472_008668 [Pythium oligandrum]|eukprot:TMW56020.1 hypothetical protein Poli38472_008668 [Pythium oligandrum]